MLKPIRANLLGAPRVRLKHHGPNAIFTYSFPLSTTSLPKVIGNSLVFLLCFGLLFLFLFACLSRRGQSLTDVLYQEIGIEGLTLLQVTSLSDDGFDTMLRMLVELGM